MYCSLELTVRGGGVRPEYRSGHGHVARPGRVATQNGQAGVSKLLYGVPAEPRHQRSVGQPYRRAEEAHHPPVPRHPPSSSCAHKPRRFNHSTLILVLRYLLSPLFPNHLISSRHPTYSQHSLDCSTPLDPCPLVDPHHPTLHTARPHLPRLVSSRVTRPPPTMSDILPTLILIGIVYALYRWLTGPSTLACVCVAKLTSRNAE